MAKNSDWLVKMVDAQIFGGMSYKDASDWATTSNDSDIKNNVETVWNDGAYPIEIKNVKNGDYFKRTASARTVYIKGDYCKSNKAYECGKADDINSSSYFKGAKIVYIGFTY